MGLHYTFFTPFIPILRYPNKPPLQVLGLENIPEPPSIAWGIIRMAVVQVFVPPANAGRSSQFKECLCLSLNRSIPA